jgi:cytosine/adenosine deaminase-related metal-dependent hydrolase
VLQGSVAPMRDGAPAGVPGAVWIDDDGLIAAVTPLDAEPAGFAGAPRVAAGGVSYPGLIDLHNHLLYNTPAAVDRTHPAHTVDLAYPVAPPSPQLPGQDQRPGGAAG